MLMSPAVLTVRLVIVTAVSASDTKLRLTSPSLPFDVSVTSPKV